MSTITRLEFKNGQKKKTTPGLRISHGQMLSVLFLILPLQREVQYAGVPW